MKQYKVEFVFFLLCGVFEVLSTILTLFIIAMLFKSTNEKSVKHFSNMLEKESQARLTSTLGGTNPSSSSMLKASKDVPKSLPNDSLPLIGSHDSNGS